MSLVGLCENGVGVAGFECSDPSKCGAGPGAPCGMSN